MEIEKLDNVLEALFFMSGDGMKIDAVTEALELQKSEVKKSITRLKEKYSGQCGIYLLVYNNKVQFCTNPAYDNEIATVLNPIKEKELSTATLETIAIIAYRQPVTRLEIENIRGVNCDYAVQVLQKLGLIEVVGRKDTIGHPLLFGTTDEFLKRFRLEDIENLPDYENLLQSIEMLKGRQAETESLYNEFEIPDEKAPEFLSEENIVSIDGATGDVIAVENAPKEAEPIDEKLLADLGEESETI